MTATRTDISPPLSRIASRMPMTTLTVRIDPETLRVLEEITGNLKAAVKLLDTNAQLLAKLLRCRLKLT